MDDQWRPQVEPLTLYRDLMDVFDRPETTWEQAYDVHSLYGDHQATGRLLELEEWPDKSRLDELKLRRIESINKHRQAVEHEIEDVGRNVAHRATSGELLPTDAAHFKHKLERILKDIGRGVNFNAVRWQIDQIRSAVNRCCQRPENVLTKSEGSPQGSLTETVDSLPTRASLSSSGVFPHSESGLSVIDMLSER